jgi:hypothetical protein
MNTAVEQLLYYLPNSIKGQFKEQIEQAKATEKQQIIYAHVAGHNAQTGAEQYYNETFKQQEQ